MGIEDPNKGPGEKVERGESNNQSENLPSVNFTDVKLRIDSMEDGRLKSLLMRMHNRGADQGEEWQEGINEHLASDGFKRNFEKLELDEQATLAKFIEAIGCDIDAESKGAVDPTLYDEEARNVALGEDRGIARERMDQDGKTINHDDSK